MAGGTSPIDRRRFLQDSIHLLAGYCLLETLFTRDVFGEEIRPVAARWAAELDALCRELRGAPLSLVAWQQQVERLLEQVPLADLLRFVDFEELTRDWELPDRAVTMRAVVFPALEGVPGQSVFHKKIVGLKQGCAIIPHGHRNMVSAHLVLEGEFALRQYDLIEDQPEHLIVEPTIDRAARAGSASSISDEMNNVHGFSTLSERAYTFDLIVTDIDPDYPRSYDVLHLDPERAEQLPNGRLRMPKLDVDAALARYGRQMHH